MGGRAWTDDELAQLAELRLSGFSQAEIARIMERPIGGVDYQLCRLLMTAGKERNIGEPTDADLDLEHDYAIREASAKFSNDLVRLAQQRRAA